MRTALFGALTLAFVTGAIGGEIPLVNADIESVTTPRFGAIDGWGPNGGWADHADPGFDKPNNETLGLNFGFMSAGGTETVGQITGALFEGGTEYNFSSWAIGGGNDTGEIVYQIGYEDGNGDFALLAQAAYNLTGAGQWNPQPGVTHLVTAGGNEIGMPIWVRLGDGVEGAPGESDVWFDNFVLTPEPASLALLALGAVAMLRRR